MCSCCRSLFLTLMSLITLGVIAATLIILTILISEQKIKEVSQTIFILFIVATVIVCLVLIFAIYASCCGGSVAKTILGIIFVILAVILLIFGIVVLAFKNNVLEYIGKLFNPLTQEYWDHQSAREVLARFFKCYYVGQTSVDYETDGFCVTVIPDKFEQYDLACGILLIIFAVLCTISAIVCFCYSCGKGKVA